MWEINLSMHKYARIHAIIATESFDCQKFYKSID